MWRRLGAPRADTNVGAPAVVGLLLLLIGCGGHDRAAVGCAEAEARLGAGACLEFLDEDGFDSLSVAAEGLAGAVAAVKYTAPLSPGSGTLPIVFQDTARWPLHVEFLAAAFPEEFPGLDAAGWEALVFRAATRRYAAGSLISLEAPCRDASFGFTVFQPTTDADRLGAADIRAVGAQLEAHTHLGPLLWVPLTELDVRDAGTWGAAAPPLQDCAPLPSYTAYGAGVAYGWVRVHEEGAFELADAAGAIGWQDIVVVPHVPFDLLGVPAAMVTGTPQGALSHVNVRLARRGAPNAFQRDAVGTLEKWNGRLVRLDVEPTGLRVSPVDDIAEAEAHWAASRPDLGELPLPDLAYRALPNLDELPVATATERALTRRRVGGKAGNLAALRGALRSGGSSEVDAELRASVVDGLAVPFYWGRAFMESNRAVFDLTDGGRAEMSFQDYARHLTEDPRFLADRAERVRRLDGFVAVMREEGRVDPALATALAARLEETFGADTMVRFRSSANLEDSLELSAAGLYESTSACAADSFVAQGDASRCAADSEPRPLQRALVRVWSSLWLPRAFEERYWWGIEDAELPVMGVLVTPAFRNEQVAGVAFTGVPTADDDRYYVTVQPGDASVVRPNPGETPETVAIGRGPEATLGRSPTVPVERLARSSLAPADADVMSDDEYRALADVLARVESVYAIDGPIDGAVEVLEGLDQSGGDVLLDLEFKLDRERALRLKQIRPFVRRTTAAPAEAFQLDVEVPQLCGGFLEFRDLATERALKTRLSLVPGTRQLPFEAPLDELQATTPLVERVEFGPEARALPPLDGGQWTRAVSESEGETWYRYVWTRAFGDADDTVTISWQMDLATRGGVPVEPAVRIDEASVTVRRNGWSAAHTGTDGEQAVRLGSCSLELLTPWRRVATLEDGTRLELDVRWDFFGLGTAPALLEAARLTRAGVTVDAEGYFDLVYAADHHNWNQRFWAFFPDSDPDSGDSGPTNIIGSVQLFEPFETFGPDVPLPEIVLLSRGGALIRRETAATYEVFER